jgi:hypothetical protein
LICSEPAASATEQDLIRFFKAISDYLMRKGNRNPAWYLLFLEAFGILRNCESLRNLERYAQR